MSAPRNAHILRISRRRAARLFGALCVALAAGLWPGSLVWAEGQAPSTASPPPDNAFPWQGEEFYYSIRLNGAEAMRASVRAGTLRSSNNRQYVPISGTARSVGFFEKVYPLDDRAHTFVDPSNFRPFRSEKYFHERGKTRTYKVDYTHSTYRAKVERTRTRSTSKYVFNIPGTTHDMMSWVYDLRSRPSLKVGDEFSYYVYDGWLLSRVDMKVVAKEDVFTPMGWFKGWKISFVREVLDSKRQKDDDGKPKKPLLRVKTPAKHSGHVWLSRDENRLPIKVAIGTSFGTSEALLIKYKPHQSQSVTR